jgi:hypothetical protein
MIVYGLWSTARPGVVRYIGQTHYSASVRLSQHLKTVTRPRNAVQKWLRRMIDAGHEISIEVLIEDAIKNADEVRLIAEYRAGGADLLNSTVGGGGTLGYRHTESERQRRADRNKGKRHSNETKARLSASLKAVPQSSAFRAIIERPKFGSENPFFGKTHSSSARHANGKARAKLDDETVRRLRALRAAGRTQDSLAAEFDISQAQVSCLVRGKTYGWVR